MPSARSSFLAAIRKRRATHPKHIRIPVQPHPDNIAREYSRALVAVMSDAHAKTKAAISAHYPKTARQDDDEDKNGATIGRIIEGIRVDTYKTVSKKRSGLLAQGVGAKVTRFATNAIGQQVKAVIAVNPLASNPALAPEIMTDFVASNVALIKTIPERYFDQVGDLVAESYQIGRRWETLSDMLEERFSVSEYNADRIARDQVSKMNAAVTQQRHADLGITSYIWRTSMDERVRETHQANEGEQFSYADPPAETGNPGDDVNCRCRAEPVLAGLLGGSDQGEED